MELCIQVTYNTLLRARSRYGSLQEVRQCLAIYQDMRKAGYVEPVFCLCVLNLGIKLSYPVKPLFVCYTLSISIYFTTAFNTYITGIVQMIIF